jgi:hypothetical protein
MKLHFMSNSAYNTEFSQKKILKLATHLFRQKWLDAGCPAFQHFYDKQLTESDRMTCYRVLHEVLKA